MSPINTIDAPPKSATAEPATAPDALTERSRATWASGEYDRIAAGFRDGAESFIQRLGFNSSHAILDAACGSGNLSIPAARTGASVTGLDLVPSLLELANAWAKREALSISFDQGNAEELPYGAATFDAVTSMFGIMFAARPDQIVRELARVTRPGGRVALANWTRDGFIGKMLALHVKHVPLPAGVSSPLLWGDESVIAERFSNADWSLVASRRMITLHWPMTPAGTAEMFRTYYGPTVRTFAALDDDGRARFSGELRELWERGNVAVEGTAVESEYLELVATRRKAGHSAEPKTSPARS